MTVLSRLVGRFAKLPPPKTHAVIVERDLKIAMPDGVLLLADRYVPRGTKRPPTILVRCPMGGAASLACSMDASLPSVAFRCWCKVHGAPLALAARSTPM